jgi:DNA-binding MarR family transcriptional regulator
MTDSLDRVSDVSSRATRALSKIVFGGAQYRIEIGAAIAALEDFKYFNGSEIAERIGVSKQTVSHELRMLEDAGLIVRIPRADDSARKVFYTPTPSVYWQWCLEASRLAAELLDRKARY